MAYVTGSARPPGCVFCISPTPDPEDDQRRVVVFRGSHAFIILNIYPYSPGHLLIAPYRHTAELESLTAGESSELLLLAQRAVRALQTDDGPHGYNLGMNLGAVAGAGIADHLHLHVVPRWRGDTNFMPVIGQTRVLPELLDTTATKLRRRLAAVDGPEADAGDIS